MEKYVEIERSIIKKYRKEAGMTQEEMANKIYGVSLLKLYLIMNLSKKMIILWFV